MPLHDSHFHNVERRHARLMQQTEVYDFEPEVAAAFDLFEYEIPLDEYDRQLACIDAMRGQSSFARIRKDIFHSMMFRWERNMPRAEREFRILAAVYCHFANTRSFSQISLDQIRHAAHGYFTKPDYLAFGRRETLFTDMQIRVTLDELQSRGLFCSCVYGNRIKYFSASLAPERLAQEVKQLHTKRAKRQTLKVSSIKVDPPESSGNS